MLPKVASPYFLFKRRLLLSNIVNTEHIPMKTVLLRRTLCGIILYLGHRVMASSSGSQARF
jgi:hypothetical protein